MRDGLGVRAERGGVEIAIVGGLVVDPILGVRYTSVGIAGGRIVALGRAGNPDTMDGIDVVLDTATSVVDATGMIVTPGGVDSHVHWLSPQIADTALAGGLTTLVIQDYGPVWNLGANPAEGLAATWAALEAHPLNAALLVRASSARPDPVERALRAGGAGLKIHEDVGAGPEQIRTALDLCDRFDVQLAIHTDGLNEALSVHDTLAAFGGRTIHAFHIEGCGGGHAPDLLALAGRDRVLTSSTSPTVPFGAGAEAEHLAMVAAVHVLAPGGRAGDWTALRKRVRPETMAAEGVLHDLGVIAMLSSDSQGMGRVGEVVRRALQNADAMKALRGAEAGPGRQRARAAPPRQGDDQPGDHPRPRAPRRLARDRQARRRRAVVAAVRGRAARARAQERDLGLGRVGRRERDDDALRAGQGPAPGRCRGRRRGAALARVPRRRRARRRAADDPAAGARRGLPRHHGRRHGPQHAHRRRAGRPGDLRGDARRRAGVARRRSSAWRSRTATCWAERQAWPTNTGSGSSSTPNAARTPSAISRASATSWPVVPAPRFVSASVCLAEIATVDGSPWPRAKPARSISHAADVLTVPSGCGKRGTRASGPSRSAARASSAANACASSTGFVKNEPAETESGSAGSMTMPLPRRSAEHGVAHVGERRASPPRRRRGARQLGVADRGRVAGVRQRVGHGQHDPAARACA